MDREQLRATQQPLKHRYRAEPEAARITLRAEGELDEQELACSVATARGLIAAGLHPKGIQERLGHATIAETMQILSRAESFPAVFYCAAGKDRTGVMAALVLDALGVESEQIVSDYHLSGQRVERIRARAAASANAFCRDTSAAILPYVTMMLAVISSSGMMRGLARLT